MPRPKGSLGPPTPHKLIPEFDHGIFWRRVQKAGADACWLWTAARNRGYGQFTLKQLDSEVR